MGQGNYFSFPPPHCNTNAEKLQVKFYPQLSLCLPIVTNKVAWMYLTQNFTLFVTDQFAGHYIQVAYFRLEWHLIKRKLKSTYS